MSSIPNSMNVIFFNEVLAILCNGHDVEAVQHQLHLLFARKLKDKSIMFDYWVVNAGFLITLNGDQFLLAECDTSIILEDNG